jgi:hypothetical protein
MTTDSPAFVIALISPSFALIGLLIGRFWDARQERKSKRDALVTRYISQLQATIQLLVDRLRNLTEEFGRGEMAEKYFRFTTLYALACPLALERIFMFDGVYPQMKAFSKDLYPHVQGWSLDMQLRGFGFHRYDRVALAECAMERSDSGFRLATYFEFRDRYENALRNNDQWLESAQKFVERMTEEQNSAKFRAISDSLNSVADQLAEHTGISRLEESGRWSSR